MAAGVAHVQQTAQRIDGTGWVFRQPKTRLSRRAVALSPETVRMLGTHRKAQLEARLLAGSAWHELDLVFTSALGTPLEPGTIRRTWRRVLAVAGVGHVRWHDPRHAHATLMLASGVHPKVVSERLGHASVGITLDTTRTSCPAYRLPPLPSSTRCSPSRRKRCLTLVSEQSLSRQHFGPPGKAPAGRLRA